MKETQTAYARKLLDPRWQKKRLEILSRDEFTCQNCQSTTETLHVHHRSYESNNPWETRNELLVTLCHECHESEGNYKTLAKDLLKEFHRAGFLNLDIVCMMISMGDMKLQSSPEEVSAAYCHAFDNPEMQTLILKKYRDRMNKIRKARAIELKESTEL